MSNPHGLESELKATVEARKELGSEYEPALLQSFLEKVDREVDSRVADRLADSRYTRPSPLAERRRRGGSSGLALGSIALGIPVSAIVTNQLHGGNGLFGLAVAWAAIAVVNVANSRHRG